MRRARTHEAPGIAPGRFVFCSAGSDHLLPPALPATTLTRIEAELLAALGSLTSPVTEAVLV